MRRKNIKNSENLGRKIVFRQARGGRVSKKYKPIDNKRERNLSFIMVKYG